ncbi:AAA family ATPase [Bacteroides salyersiae]|jgi:hypothetical protein|uniref:AAA family ATPase n=1 Tax=Bacteroides salyersiae TaxID=291644 RepID=UPI001C8B72AD|nr:ATP-binding protein [Bacteroides salyersiae]
MADNIQNPFPVVGYYGKKYFCDRETELASLSRNIRNGINTTLLSVRRLGKSALIWRLFEEFEEEKEFLHVYSDIYATQDLKSFTETLVQSVLRQIPEHKPIGRKFFELLKGFHPVISYDSLTGQPEVSFEFTQPQGCERTLQSVFQFLERQKQPVLIAIDEFQQVACYPETNAEAILRTIIQQLTNVYFIFSGSNKHMMLEIFGSAKRPFFSSTQMLRLSAISNDKYEAFIRMQFEIYNRCITIDAIRFVLEWTRSHTYYTQVVCNRLFSTQLKKVTIEEVRKVCSELLIDQQTIYIQYRNLLSPVQWYLLIGIAKEEKVYQPQASAFLKQYKIGSSAGSKRALDALLAKEMIYSDENEKGTYYQVYNVFLLRWLQLTF